MEEDMKAVLSVSMTDEFGTRKRFATDLISSALDDVLQAFIDALLGFGYQAASVEDCLIGALQENFGFEYTSDPDLFDEIETEEDDE